MNRRIWSLVRRIQPLGAILIRLFIRQKMLPIRKHALVNLRHKWEDVVVNTIEGTRAGARKLEVTISGIGERARNASLEEVVMPLKCGGHIFNNLHTRINTRHIYLTSRMVEEYSGLQLQPHKALVGS